MKALRINFLTTGKYLIAFIVCSFVFLIFFWPFILISLMFINACDTETLTTIKNLSGLDFEITSTECDIIAKDASISVFVAKTGTGIQTLIFKFDPIMVVNNKYVAPSITVMDNDIVISIERTGDIYSRQDKWNDHNIEYKIDYPFW